MELSNDELLFLQSAIERYKATSLTDYGNELARNIINKIQHELLERVYRSGQ